MRNEINVTPLVDVMLVLLILFMIATPLSQKGLAVQLLRPRPRTNAEPLRNGASAVSSELVSKK